jgi:small multidrug resistance pump
MVYLYLLGAVVFGTASNIFSKSAEGYTKPLPSLLSIITIVLCMFCLSKVMKILPVGLTYATFAGLCVLSTAGVAIVKFNQLPNFFTIVGLLFIVIGVFISNVLGSA